MRESRLAGGAAPDRAASDWGSIDLTGIRLLSLDGTTTDLQPGLRIVYARGTAGTRVRT